MSDQEYADHGERRSKRDRSSSDDSAVEAIATSTVRLGLLVLGLLLLLYAVGQAIGFDVLVLVSGALDTQMARWLIVAFFALVLITVALRGFR